LELFMTNEEFYISLYEQFSPTAEYRQIDSRVMAFLVGADAKS
jgi:hypothetical protein